MKLRTDVYSYIFHILQLNVKIEIVKSRLPEAENETVSKIVKNSA